MPRSPDTPDVSAALDRLGRGLHTGRQETRALVSGFLDGAVEEAGFGRWLLALADLGESSAEIAGVADALRDRMLAVPTTRTVIADTCGTGGDGSGSFNISTAAALVAAAAGLPVAKHGNRAMTSRTGSADVLEQLGVPLGGPPEAVGHLLDTAGFCFCMAPAHHPAMARVGPLRRALGRPTVFNLVGPLCNPAGANVQVIGVGRPAVREPVAEACRLLGARRALIVSGHVGDGAVAFDEISLFGPTDVIDVSPAGIERTRWMPEDFGLTTLPPSQLAELCVPGPVESAAAIRSVLGGAPGPCRDVVVLNAAAALWAAGLAGGLPEARVAAETAIDSGAASRLLERLAS